MNSKAQGVIQRATGWARSAIDALGVHRASRSLDPRDFQPPLPLPQGYDKARILDALCSVTIDGSAKGELRGYAIADCERFLYTLDLVPQGAGRLLEIGANPYFTTLLLRQFRPGYQMHLTNFFGAEAGEASQRIRFSGFGDVAEECELRYQSLNIEAWRFPFENDQIDVVVFGEVLEHLTNDPMHAMCEISRVLKPGGQLILTTPNAARLENVRAFVEGSNIYDPYSAYGPYGRHNREYIRHELHLLLDRSGFRPEISFTANVHPDTPASTVDPAALNAVLYSVPNRKNDLGQYLFTRSRKVGSPASRRPQWLYRSYPAESLE
jgi:SAM-dependent methyltransferase